MSSSRRVLGQRAGSNAFQVRFYAPRVQSEMLQMNCLYRKNERDSSSLEVVNPLLGLPFTVSKLLRGSILVDLIGIEPMTSSMPWKRAPSCATGPHTTVSYLFIVYG